jgi:hypothetical protein
MIEGERLEYRELFMDKKILDVRIQNAKDSLRKRREEIRKIYDNSNIIFFSLISSLFSALLLQFCADIFSKPP